LSRHIIHEGVEYVRVSDVLQPFTNFGGIDPAVLNAKAELGTNVHKIISDDIEGVFSYVCHKEKGYVDSFHKWREAICPIFDMSEERFFCKDRRITGQIDAICSINGKNYLVDFKTSVSESPTWIMQAHLYKYLCSVNGYPLEDVMLFLRLSKTGKLPQVFQYKYDYNIDRKCTKACLDYWLSKISSKSNQ